MDLLDSDLIGQIANLLEAVSRDDHHLFEAVVFSQVPDEWTALGPGLVAEAVPCGQLSLDLDQALQARARGKVPGGRTRL